MNNAHYEPFDIEINPDDTEYEEATLTAVQLYCDGGGWAVTSDNGWSLGIPILTHTRYGSDPLWTSPEPKVGDLMRTYGSFGRPVRGITLNGAVVFYRTPDLQAKTHRRMVEDMEASRARQEYLDRDKMVADFDRLIPVFQQRVAQFRTANPDFHRDSESYEVFVLLQAQSVADHYRDRANGDEPAALTLLDADRHPSEMDSFDGFNQMWGALEKAGVVSDQHSNNTAGAAIAMARAVLAGEIKDTKM